MSPDPTTMRMFAAGLAAQPNDRFDHKPPRLCPACRQGLGDSLQRYAHRGEPCEVCGQPQKL